jgi:Tol biopolymer transport system component
MIDRDDRMLADWLAEGPERGPIEGLQRTLALTRETGQRPRWVFPASWLPAGVANGVEAVPGGTRTILLVAALLLASVAALVVIAGAQRKVPPPFGPADNGRIAFNSGSSIYLADPDGSNRVPVQGGEGMDLTATFSRDGTRFAFWSFSDEQGPMSLYVANADGTGVRKISGDMAIDWTAEASPTWSPDGSKLAFASRDPGGVFRIYVVPADGSSPPLPITGTDADRTFPDWSPDGRWLAYQQARAGPGATLDLVVSNADGSAPHPVFTQAHVDPDVALSGPNWSPDSRRLVFAAPSDPSLPIGGGADVFVIDRDGTGKQRVFHDPGGHISWPGWSPGGDLLAFGTGQDAGALHVVRPDGTGARIIPLLAGRGSFECNVAFSPDGMQLVSVCRDEQTVNFIDLATGDQLGSLPSAGSFDWQRIAR